MKLSYSAANRYKQCPQKFYHSQNWRTNKRGSPLAFGTALEDGITQMLVTESVEEAVAKFYLCWENEGNNPKKPVFDNPNIEYSKSDFDKALVQSEDSFVKDSLTELELDNKYETWQDAFQDALSVKDSEKQPAHTPELLKFMNRVYWWSMRLKGRYMIESFWDQVFPKIDKVIEIDGKAACQFKIELDNEEGDELDGYIDYVIKFKDRKKPAVVDCKTSTITYTDHDIETSDQLRTYVYSLFSRYELDCEACYMVLGKRMKKTKVCKACDLEFTSTKRKCDECKQRLDTNFSSECQLLFTDYSDELLESEIDDYENILEAIDNKINFRNTSACMAFGRPCEFYDVCWKNKKPEEVKHLERRKPKRRK